MENGIDWKKLRERIQNKPFAPIVPPHQKKTLKTPEEIEAFREKERIRSKAYREANPDKCHAAENAGDLLTRKNARQIEGAITTSIKTTRNGKLKGENVKRDITKLIKTTLITLKRKSSKSESIKSGSARETNFAIMETRADAVARKTCKELSLHHNGVLNLLWICPVQLQNAR